MWDEEKDSVVFLSENAVDYKDARVNMAVSSLPQTVQELYLPTFQIFPVYFIRVLVIC